MRILVVSQYFWPENFRINDLVSGLLERGNRVTVLTGRPNYPVGTIFKGYGLLWPWRESYGKATVFRVPLIPRGKGGGANLLLNYVSFVISAGLLGPLLAGKKHDVILVYEPSPITVGIPALVMKVITGAPLLFWLQDLWPESLSATGAVRAPWALKVVELMVRMLYKGCDRILVQSRAFLPAVRRLGAEPSKTHYYPNSAENFYSPVSVPYDAPERALMPNGFCLTFAGNIGVAQDFDNIIGAAQLLAGQEKIHFVIIGEGRMRDRIASSIAEKGLSKTVHLLGRHPAERMPFFFALSDALLVTLRRDPIFALTVPSKVQSYLACGRPIVAALDGEGARVIQEAGAGLTCKTQCPETLSKTILTMYHLTHSERNAMGGNGRRLFECEFERELLLDKLERWLQDVRGTSTDEK